MATTLKQIDALIKRVRTNGEKLNALIHEAGVLVLEHAQEHGDCSRAQALVMAMPASMRRTSLIAWFSQFSPIVVKNSDDWDAKMHKPQTASGADNPLFRPFDIEGAKAKPFWQIANENRERDPASFEDLLQQFERFAKRIEKQIDDNMIVEKDVEKAKAVVRVLEGLDLKSMVSANSNGDEGEEGSPANDSATNADGERQAA